MLINLIHFLFSESLITNLFRYVSFRALLAAIMAFSVVIFLMPRWIDFLKKRSIKQMIRDDGPKTHLAKAGTPTMGGLVMLLAISLSVLSLSKLTEVSVWIGLFALIAFGLVGFIDDGLKFTKKNTKGVSFRAKMVSLGLISVAVAYLGRTYAGLTPDLAVPFFKSLHLDLGHWFYFWAFIVLCGGSNAVNLTDGLDGLAIVPIMTTAFVLLITSYVSGHIVFSNYLQFQYLQGSQELVIGMAAVIGAGLGFLWFNCHPAEIFMGDVGSLSLGGYLGAVALLTHKELVFGMAGFLFVLEALSVMLQVGSYKLRKKRIFKMAPLHHHFELSGWVESKTIVRFWILSVLFAFAALSTLKLR